MRPAEQAMMSIGCGVDTNGRTGGQEGGQLGETVRGQIRWTGKKIRMQGEVGG